MENVGPLVDSVDSWGLIHEDLAGQDLHYADGFRSETRKEVGRQQAAAEADFSISMSVPEPIKGVTGDVNKSI